MLIGEYCTNKIYLEWLSPGEEDMNLDNVFSYLGVFELITPPSTCDIYNIQASIRVLVYLIDKPLE